MEFNKDKVVEVIGMYFYETDFNTMDVIAVDVGYENKKPYVSLTSRRPGVLIGYHGRYISDLTEHLCEYFGFNINVKVVEDRLWASVPIAGEVLEY